MHQIIKNILKNILTKSFFPKNIPLFFICENYTLSIDFYVKLMRSYLSILKQFFKNLLVKLLLLQEIYEILKDFPGMTLYFAK